MYCYVVLICGIELGVVCRYLDVEGFDWFDFGSEVEIVVEELVLLLEEVGDVVGVGCCGILSDVEVIYCMCVDFVMNVGFFF